LVSYGADPHSDRGTEALEWFGVKPGGYLLFIGRLVPEDAPDQYLEGVRLSVLEIPAVVVGDSAYQEAYKRALRA
jgi:hypothetical protein